MNVLITGSSGMIGSALAEDLLKRGHVVFGFDKEHPKFFKNFQYYQINLLQPIHIEFDANIDVVIHLAANARVHELVLNPVKALENGIMTHNILEWVRSNKVRKFIFASSREVYGDQDMLPVREDVATQRSSKSVYTANKIAGEAYCYAYQHCYGIDCKIVRFSNVYGRFDFSDRFIPKVIDRLMQNEDICINGDNKTLDFTYLDDCIQGILCLVNNWEIASYSEYNIASGVQLKLVTVAEKMKKVLNSKSKIVIGSNLTGEVFNYQADTSRIQKLGFKPRTTIDAGIRKAISYYTKFFSSQRLNAIETHETLSGQRSTDNLIQCHTTSIQSIDRQEYFVKEFQPYSYELTNEVHWLTSPVVESCKTFAIPRVIEFSAKSGKLIMEYIGHDNPEQEKSLGDKLNTLLRIAAEIHSLIGSKRPFLKYAIPNPSEYAAYLKRYISVRIGTLSSYKLNYSYFRQVIGKIDVYDNKNFAIVHRDLRVRHLLWPNSRLIPFLVDWEYANIGDPAQDVAKIIYEHIMNGTPTASVTQVSQSIIEKYCNLVNIQDDDLKESLKMRVNIFLPIVSLENASSFEMRKPDGYRDAISKEVTFINSLSI